MRRLIFILAALAMTAAGGAVSSAHATSAAAPRLVLEDVHQRAVFVPGVEKLVRQQVPAQFKLVHDPLGRSLLAVVAARAARYAVGDEQGAPTTFWFFVAVIESPDGSGCLSRAPLVGELKPDVLPFCNSYGFYAAYDNLAVVQTIRAQIPGIPVYDVPNHVYRQETFDLSLGPPFDFQAGPGTEGPRTPSPFTLDGIAREAW